MATEKPRLVWETSPTTPWRYSAWIGHASLIVERPRRARVLAHFAERPWGVEVLGNPYAVQGRFATAEEAMVAAERVAAEIAASVVKALRATGEAPHAVGDEYRWLDQPDVWRLREIRADVYVVEREHVGTLIEVRGGPPSSDGGWRRVRCAEQPRAEAPLFDVWANGYVHYTRPEGDPLLDESTARAPDDEREEPLTFDFAAFFDAKAAWSRATFGPGDRYTGVCAHIRKELAEIEANPADVVEWVDVVLLALDGAWRSAGADGVAFVAAMLAKDAKNRARSWPDWRTLAPGDVSEHVRESRAEAPEVDEESAGDAVVVDGDGRDA